MAQPDTHQPDSNKSDQPLIDEPTGTEFVGHEWDGIQELNTPLPRWWLWTFYASIAFAAVYVVLYPAWPMVERATTGVLGWSSRGQLADEMSAADSARSEVFERIAATEITDLPADPELMGQAIAGGAAAFKQHCVQCHGAGAAGYEQYGFPNLNDDDWLWGGELTEIEYTLTHGIRWDGSDDTRVTYMPAFEGILDSAQVGALVSHVLSLSGQSEGSAAGAQLFADNCAACHQATGGGDRDLGAPALNDAIWLYGDSPANIRRQILYPRHGVMPGWSDKLDPVTIRMLATYIHSRGGGEYAETTAEDSAPEDAETTDAVAAASEEEGDGRLSEELAGAKGKPGPRDWGGALSSTESRPAAATNRHAPSQPPQRLYEKRTAVHNKRIDGPFRRFKWLVMLVTLAIYYITPWIRWDRGPYAPDQAVLVDLAHRRFYMFDIEIWPHEFYFVAGMLIMAGIGLFLVTSAVGRAWCGYACPQTVWTDLFQHVDRLFDGDRNARARLDKAPWGPSKAARRLSKWSVYLLISMLTGGAWILYFADAPTLFGDFFTLRASPIAYATVGILTFTTFWLGGFMREQVCIYMCPWPRIQTAMLDEKSLIVTYKDWRGEQRGSLKKSQKEPEKYGDCIDCRECVAVCPTGIDIREGQQIGCITCALCIDACDRVMKDIGRPRGLIDYATLEQCEAEAAGAPAAPAWKALLRPRTFVYFGVWGAIGMAMLFALGTRTHTDLTVSPDRNPPFMLMKDGSVRNAYTLRLRNMEARPRDMEIALTGLPSGAVMWTDRVGRGQAALTQIVTVPANETRIVRAYVLVPSRSNADAFAFQLTSMDEQGEQDIVETSFTNPGSE